MSKELRPKVGLLGLTLEFYEKNPQLRIGREDWVRRAVLPALEPFADVEFNGACYRRPDVEATVRDFEQQDVDALLVILLSYSPSQITLPALKRTNLPIIVWNTQELRAVDDSFTGQFMTDNHGVHGTQDLCNVLLRSGVEFDYVTSHLDDEGATDELEDFFAAAAAAHRLRAARVGRLGYPFPGMGDFALDTTHLAATLGLEWVNLSVGDYVKRAAQADAAEVANLVAEYNASYDVSDEITDRDMEQTARAELALRGMVRSEDLDAVTYQFLAFGDDDRVQTVPFVAASRLMAEGIGFGGEGDVISAGGTALLNWLQPPASFVEIFTIDFEGNALFISHMGEANVAMARSDRPAPLRAREKNIVATRGRELALVTTFQPGPATFYALTQGPENVWRLIASTVTVEDWGPLPNMQVPHAKISPDGDVRDFLTDYALAGGPHHAALCFGDARRRIAMAANMLGAEYWEV